MDRPGNARLAVEILAVEILAMDALAVAAWDRALDSGRIGSASLGSWETWLRISGSGNPGRHALTDGSPGNEPLHAALEALHGGNPGSGCRHAVMESFPLLPRMPPHHCNPTEKELDQQNKL